MGLRELKMALLIPTDSLLLFFTTQKRFINHNETSLIQDRCCHLTCGYVFSLIARVNFATQKLERKEAWLLEEPQINVAIILMGNKFK